jgi:hypothetical protein
MTPEHLNNKRIKCLLDWGQLIYSNKEIFIYTSKERIGLENYLNGLYKVWLEQGDNFVITTNNLRKFMSKSDVTNQAHRNLLIPVFIKTKTYQTKSINKYYTKLVSLTPVGVMLMQEIHKRKMAKTEEEAIDDKHIESGTETEK